MGDGVELATAVDEPRCRMGHDVDHNLGNGLARETAHHGAERYVNDNRAAPGVGSAVLTWQNIDVICPLFALTGRPKN